MGGRLGLDVGGVIIALPTENDQDFEEKSFLKTPPVKGAIAAIRALALEYFGPDNIWFISKCRARTAVLSPKWFRLQGVFETTGISGDHILTCLRREDKATRCRELGITHFVDNRLSVLAHMVDVVPNLFLFQGVEEELVAPEYQELLKRISRAKNWPAMVQLILASENLGS